MDKSAPAFVGMKLLVLMGLFVPFTMCQGSQDQAFLTPGQCRLAEKQCRTSYESVQYVNPDVSSQLMDLREFYQRSMDHLSSYISYMINTLKKDPSASPLVSLCAQMGDPFFGSGLSNIGQGQATKSTTIPVSQATRDAKAQLTVEPEFETTATSEKPTREKDGVSSYVAAVTDSEHTSITKGMSTLAAEMTSLHTENKESTSIGSSANHAVVTADVDERTSHLLPTTEANTPSITMKEVTMSLASTNKPAGTSTDRPQTKARRETSDSTETGFTQAGESKSQPSEAATAVPTAAATTTTDPSRPTSKLSTEEQRTSRPEEETAGMTTEGTASRPRTPSPTTSRPSTTTITTTTRMTGCVVGTWGEWSAPFGFGVQRRERKVVIPALVCPEASTLQQLRPADVQGTGLSFADNYTLVADNFVRDFLRVDSGPRDLLIILHASDSVTTEGFEVIQGALKMLLGLFCNGFGHQSTENRLSLVEFSTEAAGRYVFGDDQRPAALARTIESLLPTPGKTCTGKGLTMGSVHFQPVYGCRPNVTHHTLLITDARSNCPDDVKRASRDLQQLSTVFAVGIGMSADPYARQELQNIASDGDSTRIFSLDSFQAFLSMLESIQDRYSMTGCDVV